MALAVYLAVDGTDDDLAVAAAQVGRLRPRDPTDPRPPREWLAAVLADVVEDYLRNAAALAARQAAPAPLRLTAPPTPAGPGPTWDAVNRVEVPLPRVRPGAAPTP